MVLHWRDQGEGRQMRQFAIRATLVDCMWPMIFYILGRSKKEAVQQFLKMHPKARVHQVRDTDADL